MNVCGVRPESRKLLRVGGHGVEVHSCQFMEGREGRKEAEAVLVQRMCFFVKMVVIV